MEKPIIGVTTYQGKNEQGHTIIALLRAYTDALVQAGGIPLLIPANLNLDSVLSTFTRLDAILFTGGGDIALNLYNGEPHPRVNEVDDERDSMELAFLDVFIRGKKPFLGICRGFQMIHVGLGGTLYTDIEDQKQTAIKHDYYPGFPRNYLAHEVKIEKGTHLAKILGRNNLQVNSLHHQGAKEISEKLRPTAYASDGLVEAFELTDHPFGIAVQWHPEWLTDQPAASNLFRAFIEAANI